MLHSESVSLTTTVAMVSATDAHMKKIGFYLTELVGTC